MVWSKPQNSSSRIYERMVLLLRAPPPLRRRCANARTAVDWEQRNIITVVVEDGRRESDRPLLDELLLQLRIIHSYVKDTNDGEGNMSNYIVIRRVIDKF